MAKGRKCKNLGPLQDLLIKACPPDKDGIQSISGLAKAMGVTPQALYKYLTQGWINNHAATKIFEVGEGRVTKEELMEFMFVPN